jgi:hypothetical protein
VPTLELRNNVLDRRSGRAIVQYSLFIAVGVRKNAIIAQKSIAGALENRAPTFGFDLLHENDDPNGAHAARSCGIRYTRGRVPFFKIPKFEPLAKLMDDNRSSSSSRVICTQLRRSVLPATICLQLTPRRMLQKNDSITGARARLGDVFTTHGVLTKRFA